MDRDTAQRLVGKLREVRVDRGATPAEAKTAQAKADRLEARFGAVREAPRPRRAARPTYAAPAWGPAVPFVDLAGLGDFIKTGKAPKGAKVHRYTSRSNWKVEFEA